MRTFIMRTVFLACAVWSLGSGDAWSVEYRELPRAVGPREQDASFFEDSEGSHDPGPDFAAPLGSDGSPDWNQLLDSSGGSAITFGVSIASPVAASRPDQPSAFERNATRAFAPASVSKIFTTSTALELLGPKHRFETQLTWEEDGSGRARALKIWGEGDPTWGMRGIDPVRTDRARILAQALYAAGVRELEGTVLFGSKDPRWMEDELAPGWDPVDQQYCYGAPVSAINIQENCAAYRVTGRTTGMWVDAGVPTPVSVALSSASSTLINVQIVTNWGGQTGVVGYKITGTWSSADQADGVVSLPVRNAPAWAARLVATELEALGVKRVAASRAARDWVPRTASVYSPELGEVVKAINKPSNNLGAEALARALGHHLGRTNAGLLKVGREVMAAHFSEVAKRSPALDFDLVQELSPMDGSGLSRLSRVTPRAVIAYLHDLPKQPYWTMMWESLPIAGVDGTLESRMKGTAAEGVLRAKTGTLSGFYQLAGFVPYSGGYLPFVALTQTTSAYRTAARSAQDRVGAALASWVK